MNTIQSIARIDRQLLVVYANLSLYAFCYQMQQPVLPATVKNLVVGESSAQEWAQLQSWFGIMQLGGGLVSGVLSDKFGSKTLLLLSFFSSALCYLMQANADTMAMLYLSQVPTIFQHAFMGATAFITDRTDAVTRAHMLGYCSVAYGVGMLFGPALGGWLGTGHMGSDLSTSAWIAAAGSLLSCLSILLMLDDESKFTPSSSRDTPKEPFSFNACLKACMQPTVFKLAMIKVAGSLAMSVWHSAFYGGMAESDFGISIQQLGLLTSYLGALGMITQLSGFVKYTTVNYDDKTINMGVGGILAVIFILTPVCAESKGLAIRVFDGTGFGTTTNWATLQFLILLIPISAAFTLLRNLSTTQFTKCVGAAQAGTIIGLDMGIGSAVRIVGPLIGGSIVASEGLFGVAVFCSAMFILMAALSGAFMPEFESDKGVKKKA